MQPQSSTAGRTPEKGSAPPESPLTRKLESAREGVRLAAHMVSASEGRLLDYESADEINRALQSVQRELEELKMSLLVQERRSSSR